MSGTHAEIVVRLSRGTSTAEEEATLWRCFGATLGRLPMAAWRPAAPEARESTGRLAADLGRLAVGVDLWPVCFGRRLAAGQERKV